MPRSAAVATGQPLPDNALNMPTILSLFAVMCSIAAATASADPRWVPDHTVVVVLENKSANQIVGAADMPYLNGLIAGGALMTRAYFAQTPYTGDSPAGLPARPSQPNYLYLFSGHHQGVLPGWQGGIDNGLIPAAKRPFTTPNLGAALIESGRSFASFSESLPYPHWDGKGDRDLMQDRYRRKHNPAINWINLPGRHVSPGQRRFLLPVATNLAFEPTRDPVDGRRYRGFALDEDGRPLGYDSLPTLSLVVPNEQHDSHSSSKAACDQWLRDNVGPYERWARANNSLLVITYDEDGSTDRSRGDPYRRGIDRIVTLFVGPAGKVLPGRYDESIDHLNVLATLLDRLGLLEQFRADFLAAHGSDEGRVEHAHLRPIRDVFGEGPPLR